MSKRTKILGIITGIIFTAWFGWMTVMTCLSVVGVIPLQPTDHEALAIVIGFFATVVMVIITAVTSFREM